jgi:two-component system response regulator NreC
MIRVLLWLASKKAETTMPHAVKPQGRPRHDDDLDGKRAVVRPDRACFMKIVAIEDQTLFRQLLLIVCRNVMPEASLVEASTGREGVEVVRREQPDLVLLDVSLPDGDGILLASELRVVSPRSKVLIISAHTDEYTLMRVQRAGVQGFVDKNADAMDHLRQAVRAVLEGKPYFGDGLQTKFARMKNDAQSFNKILSDREMDLLVLFGQGCTNEDIAARLDLRPNTVRNHRQNIMTKLGLSSTPQLIRYAFEKGFTRVGP